MRWLDCTLRFELFQATHEISLPCIRQGVCEREIFRLPAKQREKSGSCELSWFLCSQRRPFSLPLTLLQGGQIQLTEHQIPERKSHAFSWNLSYTILPWKGGMWDVGWDEMELFNLWKRQNDAGFFMHVNLSLKMLFLMHLFTLVFGFDGGV